MQVFWCAVIIINKMQLQKVLLEESISRVQSCLRFALLRSGRRETVCCPRSDSWWLFRKRRGGRRGRGCGGLSPMLGMCIFILVRSCCCKCWHLKLRIRIAWLTRPITWCGWSWKEVKDRDTHSWVPIFVDGLPFVDDAGWWSSWYGERTTACSDFFGFSRAATVWRDSIALSFLFLSIWFRDERCTSLSGRIFFKNCSCNLTSVYS